MTRKELVKALFAHNGPIFVNFTTKQDAGIWVKVVRKDLVSQFTERFAEDEETGVELLEDGSIETCLE